MATTQRTERKAYSVNTGYDEEIRTWEYTVVITPKRYAVTSGRFSASHFDNEEAFLRAGYRWTLKEAWQVFLERQRDKLQDAQDAVETHSRHIEVAEKTLTTMEDK
jgi:hypothetical protein